jgi:hypothetical protein
MAAPTIEQLLRYANLQMAAEAILPREFQGLIPLSELTDGNGRNSRFPSTLAAEFASRFEVLRHQENTGTGFSGTLFRDLESKGG